MDRRIEMEKYPCKECILKGNCSELCDKISPIWTDPSITDFIFDYNHCMDCGCEKCSVYGQYTLVCDECNSAYYFTIVTVGRVAMISRINKAKKSFFNSEIKSSRIESFARYIYWNGLWIGERRK
jgi:hypothetical protein